MHGGSWADAHVVTRSDDDLFDLFQPDPGIVSGYRALALALIADPPPCSNCGERPASRGRKGRCERCRT